jgi:hypothetical protein
VSYQKRGNVGCAVGVLAIDEVWVVLSDSNLRPPRTLHHVSTQVKVKKAMAEQGKTYCGFCMLLPSPHLHSTPPSPSLHQTQVAC